MVGRERLRIAQVAFALHCRGGVEKSAYELCLRLAADHEVHVFAERCELSCPGLTVHPVRPVSRPWLLRHMAFFFSSARSLKEEAGYRPFDIVHVHSPCAARCDLATAHSVYRVGERCIRPHLTRLQRARRRLTAGGPALPAIAAYNYQPRRCARVIAVSRKVKREVMDSFGMPEDRVDVVYCGVDSEKFHPNTAKRVRERLRSQMKLAPQAVAAIFVANVFKGKGLDVLLRAAALLGPRERPYLIVVGETRDRNFSLDAARRMARDLGLAEWVRFLGKVERVEELYAAADLFCMPTLYEAFGQVVTEAMASGLPVIVSRAAGVAEILQEGREALLLEDPSDPREVAARLRVLAASPDLRERMGAAARRTALTCSWDRVAELNLASYRSVLLCREKLCGAGALACGSWQPGAAAPYLS